MTTISRVGPNVAFSVFRFLADTTYTVGTDTKTLVQFFGVEIKQAYPDDLTTITRSLLALSEPDEVFEDLKFYGDPAQEDVITLSIYGFVVGQGSDVANKKYRDRLANDLYYLFSKIGADEGITYYEHASKAVLGEIEVGSVRLRMLPSNVPEIDADRYRFVLDVAFSVSS